MSAFDDAWAQIEAGDLDGLRAALVRRPGLVVASGDNENDLLAFAVARRDARAAELLLDHGASPAHVNVHGWTALHQAAYVGEPALAEQLLDAGAPTHMEARGEGGTALVVALFWGHARTAELLAARGGVAPANLRVAAGLGDQPLLDRLIAADGTLAPAAGSAREFHRPHSGFPGWEPADDAAEVRDEALAWAARNGRVEALELLAARGASLDADVYRGTALAWAAARGRAEAVRTLLALGADPGARTSFGGDGHGEQATALHLAAESGDRATIAALLDAGADRTARDARHDATPAAWAEHAGRADAAALLA
ncbi:ankyrin repeat domain-containing protein [Conexibacter sp. JD483]|uniref:ankyrin repeat domain-containing protein n=1 Tax=unclassified Conexibacter TaxID=2627773 RepID=UPI00271C3F15|nr:MULTISPECIES: ankyrin repeat domain-containing protein [unclassified Conexibacter]MDO8185639.1 ankyrin repeat domain-containing protein [Conexibacter sp. CPCC 205706]MDO8198812.1 ankyrin repeat domain-containing protein [Conexibacter sp. CPCC 205762]MDR9367838.1 ankyrin repeat domain-containing protein [Conexibacter sp. JD483]